MVKRAILFINGDLAQLPRINFRKGDFLIGVDGGTRLCRRLGLKPDIIIGDFDSYSRSTKLAKKAYLKDQNFTDTEKSLLYCVKHGFKDIVLVGVLGRRLDHLLANIFLGTRYNLTMIEGRQTLYFVSSRMNLEGEAGDLVSLIPLSDCAGVTTFGLKWRLQGSTLKVGTSRGISNVLIGKSCRISLKKGRLLVIQTEPLG